MNSHVQETSTPPPDAPAADGRSARWDAHRAERRRELLKLARRAIHRLGPGASMDDIAADAATSKSVFYRYFGDKDGLRQRLAEAVIADFHAHVISAGRSGATEHEALHSMVLAYLNLASGSPNIYFFVTSTGSSDVLTSPAGAEPTGMALDGFFTELTAMMTERLHVHLDATQTTGSPVWDLWPRAAIGMVRSAGELWLRQDPGHRPPAKDLARGITQWLTRGIDRPRADDESHDFQLESETDPAKGATRDARYPDQRIRGR
ncbi:TetR/AcrR family transcriptional regulator [Paeniglutamicibacter cryotolerans]|uniref:AcrR family transcriptional regulator n=1 Tax=Paeniglutamicibacter cryotolerans TaxID=670079 RepID=A0A839QTI8_9MICC|nr:TetR/AcrR family transcriptional regulator [Paeniglutamicibacter cryotolerans]MBB2997286.1 AcrR family transcriptional regulator [Paeniglutamicibacter cryotolerans]